jgi:ribonuclease Z
MEERGVNMSKLIVLGTGNAMVTNCYNTCFAVSCPNGEHILVDAGGGNGILVQMKKAKVEPNTIHHLIVTHEHCDHLLGVVWVVRKIGTMMLGNKYAGQLHIYCHPALCETIVTLATLTLQKKFVNLFGDRIILHSIENGTKMELAGQKVEFFDIYSTKAPQFGFSMVTAEGKKVTCLGDEPYNPLCRSFVEGSEWLLCEAFCLYSQRDRFKPYEKHHSTVREACQLAQELEIPHLVLWHTEDENYSQRKTMYMEEGRGYYNGDLHVPYDLEEINLA